MIKYVHNQNVYQDMIICQYHPPLVDSCVRPRDGSILNVNICLKHSKLNYNHRQNVKK